MKPGTEETADIFGLDGLDLGGQEPILLEFSSHAPTCYQRCLGSAPASSSLEV